MRTHLLAAGLACTWLAGCTVESDTRVIGVGVEARRMVELARDPAQITVGDGLDLVVLPPTGSEAPHAVIAGYENLLAYVRVEEVEGKLRLSVERGFSLSPAPSVRVVASEVTALRCVGAGSVEVLDLVAERLELDVTGSGSLRATGRVDRLELKAVGSGALDLSELLALEAQVETIGSGSIRLHAEEALDVRSIGSGTVSLSGGARIEQTVVGSGAVERVER